MWAPPGPVLGANGHVYVASGNGAGTSGRWDKSDSVAELTEKKLRLVSAFAPSTWRQDNTEDRDLGSTSPLPVPAVHRIVIVGKRGVVYLLHEQFGGVGSQVATHKGCAAWGGGARRGRIVLLPCLARGQIRAMRAGHSHLHWVWSAT